MRIDTAKLVDFENSVLLLILQAERALPKADYQALTESIGEQIKKTQRCLHIGKTRDGYVSAECQQPKGHDGKHGGMGCEWTS